MQKCKFCGCTIEEFIKWDFQKKRQWKKFVCPCCGPLHYRTLQPITAREDKARV